MIYTQLFSLDPYKGGTEILYAKYVITRTKKPVTLPEVVSLFSEGHFDEWEGGELTFVQYTHPSLGQFTYRYHTDDPRLRVYAILVLLEFVLKEYLK